MRNKALKFYTAVLTLIICFNLSLNCFSLGYPIEYISIEAEDSTIIDHNEFELAQDSEASGGYAIKSIIPFENDDNQSISVKTDFNVEKMGRYHLYIRAKAEKYIGRKATYSIDNGNLRKMPFEVSNQYEWNYAGEYDLKKGIHTINLNARQAGFYVDKFFLTKSNTYKPEGMENPPPDIFEEGYENEFPDTEYPLPNEHPRLLLRSSDLPELRAKYEDPYYADVVSTIENHANRDYNTRLPDLQEGQESNHNRNYIMYIEANAFLYLLNNIESYATKAIEGIINYLDTLSIVSGDYLAVTREGGNAIFTAAEVYDWCYPELTEEQKRQIIRLCLFHATNMEFGWPLVDKNPFLVGHINENMLIKDLFAFSVAVYDEFPDAYNLVSKRIFNEFIPTFNYFYDGSSFHNQGSFYGRGRHSSELNMKWILNALGYGDLVSENQHWLSYHFIYNKRPDGDIFSDGDCNPSDVYFSSTRTAILAGNFYNDPYIKQELFRSGRTNGTLELGAGPYTMTNAGYLILDNKDIGIKPLSELPLSHYFGNQTGLMVARTGWEDGKDSNSMVVTMKTPEKFFKGHAHLDSGEFEIYYKGALALDSGAYVGVGTDHSKGYYRQTIAHNCMLIYDPDEISYYGADYPSMGGQVPQHNLLEANSFEDFIGEATDYGKVLGYDYGSDLNKPDFTYLKGDLTKAYNGKAEKYMRSFMFFNFFDDVYPGALIVFDKVTASEASFKKTWLIHSQETPEVNGNVITIKRTEDGYNGRLTNHSLLPKSDDMELTVVGGEGQEYLAGERNYEADLLRDSGRYRVEVSPKSLKTTDYFLNVMQVSEYNENIPVLETQYYESGDFVGVRIKDRVAYFSKSDQRTQNDVTVYADGSEDELIYVVEGLKEGTWEINNGEDVIGVCNVTSDGGVLSFSGNAGTYNLTYLNSTYYNKDFNLFNNAVSSSERVIYTKYNENILSIYPKLIEDEIYVPVKKAAELFGAVFEQIDSDSVEIKKDTETLVLTANRHKVIKNDAVKYSKNEPRYIDNLLYAPLSAMNEILNISFGFYDERNMLMISDDNNAIDGLLDDLRFNIYVTVIGEGNVSETGVVTVTADETKTFELTADEGYYLSGLSFNNIPIAVTKNEYTTPNITKDSHLRVEFDLIESIPSNVLGIDRYFNDNSQGYNHIVTFGKITGDFNKVKEYGVIYSLDNPLLTLEENGIRKFQYRIKEDLSNDLGEFKIYGIELIDTDQFLGTNFYLRNYMVYEQDNEEITVYTPRSLNIKTN